MRCEGCLKKDNLFMCFFSNKSKEIYLCAECLAKLLFEDPTQIYSMTKIGYTWI